MMLDACVESRCTMMNGGMRVMAMHELNEVGSSLSINEATGLEK